MLVIHINASIVAAGTLGVGKRTPMKTSGKSNMAKTRKDGKSKAKMPTDSLPGFSTADFFRLLLDLKVLNSHLDGLPDSQEWTQEQLADLEDVRHAALQLANTVEATIHTFEGSTGQNAP